MEFESARLTVDFERHNVDLRIVELDPSDVISVGAEPKGFGVGEDFFFVNPVGDAVENGPGNA